MPIAPDETTKLMERVLRESGGNYLSDLHADANAMHVYRAVRAIPVPAYPAEAWKALADYVMREPCGYGDAEQAVSALLQYLSKKG